MLTPSLQVAISTEPPMYFDHRGADGTHVFSLEQNGMDIKINNTAETGQYLEYYTIGGIVDLYFMAGP